MRQTPNYPVEINEIKIAKGVAGSSPDALDVPASLLVPSVVAPLYRHLL